MEITFRKATEKDWKEVNTLEKGAESKYYATLYTENGDSIKEYIRESRVFLILKDSEPIGTVSYKDIDKDTADIDGLTVSKGLQGQGIATRAVEFVLKQLKGKKKATLVVHPGNSVAIRIYLKLGFSITGWKENFFGDGEPRLLMEKIL